MSDASKAPKQRTRSDYRYSLTYRTRWSDNDQYSHVNNAIYYHLMDSVVNTYLAEQCGCTPSSLTSSDAPPIGLVVSSHCDFFAPISFPDVVALGLRVVRLGRSSVSYEIGFFAETSSSISGDTNERDEKEETAKAVGGYTHVFVDRVNRRPVKEMGMALRSGLQAISSERSIDTKSKL